MNSLRPTIFHSTPILFGIFFLLICVIRYESVFLPPYWDSIVGLFAEATWLADNDFDYLRLAYEIPGYGAGGPRVYFFSVYPAFQAILLKLIPESYLFLMLNHLLTFCYATIVLVAFYRLLCIRGNAWFALAGTMLLMMHPMFLSQTDAINMEMPVLAATLLGIVMTLRHRPISGALAVILALSLKPTAVIGVIVVFVYHALTTTANQGQTKKAMVLLGIAILSVPVQWWLRGTFNQESNDMLVVFFRGSLKQILFDMPDFFALYVVGGVFFCAMAVTILRNSRLLRIELLIQSFSEYNRTPTGRINLIMILFFVFFTGFYIHIVNILPRYLLYCLPVLLYFLTTGLLTVLERPQIVITAVTVLIFLQLTNREGRLYIPDSGNNGFILERSLEYRDDMRLNRQLVQHLEEHYRNHTIVTSWPMAQMLTIPELGYVDRPFQVLTSDRPCLYGPTEQVTDDILNEPDVIWVYTPNAFSRKNTFYPEDDHLITTLSYGDRIAHIYVRTTW